MPNQISIVSGPPLEEEPGLGALTLGGYLREVVQEFGSREALVFHHAGGALRWTYNDLWERSLDVARALRAGGLAKGARVGILMTNRPEFLAAFFGTALAGGVATPLSTFSTPSELEHLVQASACSVLLIEREVLKKDFLQILRDLEPMLATAPAGALQSAKFPFLTRVVAVGGESAGAIESWDAFLARGAAIEAKLVEATAAAVAPSDPGALFFSSGSTARPKGILSAHRGPSIQLWRWRRTNALEGDVRAWAANGFFWSGNFAMTVGGAFSSGGAIVLQRTFDPEEALGLMQKEKVNYPFAWPHQWAQLEGARNWADVDLSAMRFVDRNNPVGRHPTVKTNWREASAAFGNTETFTLATGYPSGTPEEEIAGSSGVALPGNTVKIVDPLTGAVLPLGEKGEIALKGPTLMLGYLGAPLADTLDAEGFLRTGDGGYLDAKGRLYWQGRLNDIIKTGGANVSPVEIDEVIRACPGVKVAQTVGVPHDTLGELVVSCIVPHDGAALTEERVKAFAKEKLASYKVPRRVLFFAEDDLKVTGSNKVKTADLRDLAAKRL